MASLEMRVRAELGRCLEDQTGIIELDRQTIKRMLNLRMPWIEHDDSGHCHQTGVTE